MSSSAFCVARGGVVPVARTASTIRHHIRPSSSSSPSSSAAASSASAPQRRQQQPQPLPAAVVGQRRRTSGFRGDAMVAAAGPSSSSSSSSSNTAPPPPPPTDAFAQLERLLAQASAAGGSSGERGWREVEGAWVLGPPKGATPRAVVHFVGGAFVGASPQLTYRLFLEALASRGRVLIIATPFAIGFDHLRIADEAQFRFDRCMRTLSGEVEGLPIFGVGHSMGALMHMIIGSRYALQREANVLISFNNKPATDAVPLFAPVVAPGLQGLSPIIAGLAGSPLRAPARAAEAQLRDLSPPIFRELLPVLDQLEPVLLEVVNGAAEFIPAPEDTKRLIRTYYAVKRNLLVRFRDDGIDETPQLAATLTESSAISETLDLAVRSLPGDHVRPLRQQVPLEVPPEVAAAAVQTGDFLSGFADALGIRADNSNPLGQLRSGFEAVKSGAKEVLLSAGPGSEDAIKVEMTQLAEEIVAWMMPGLEPEVVAAKPALDAGKVVTPIILPPPSVV